MIEFQHKNYYKALFYKQFNDIKAFKENAYDLFDGEIQNSGIALLFVREFDRFRKKKTMLLTTPDDSLSIQKNDPKD